QLDTNHVVLLVLAVDAIGHGPDLVGPVDDSFGDEEAGDELEVVARRAHGDGRRHAAHTDLERLLGRERVVPDLAVGVVDPQQLVPAGDARHDPDPTTPGPTRPSRTRTLDDPDPLR